MNTQISSKLAALAAALLMNTIIIGGMSVLFNSKLRERSSAISFVHQAEEAAARAAA
jgi:hypothetical protein